MENGILFYILATVIVLCSFMVVVALSPIYSALFLAVTMIALSGIFYLLGAHFIAGVQLIVYAGAVIVLFVMVLMLFDLKREVAAFSRGTFSGILKLVCAGALLGLVIGGAERSTEMMTSVRPEALSDANSMSEMKVLAGLLFSKYLLAFEVLGILLLLIAVGVVAVSRVRGGTHAGS